MPADPILARSGLRSIDRISPTYVRLLRTPFVKLIELQLRDDFEFGNDCRHSN
jgi:hypothetical protein